MGGYEIDEYCFCLKLLFYFFFLWVQVEKKEDYIFIYKLLIIFFVFQGYMVIILYLIKNIVYIEIQFVKQEILKLKEKILI